MKLAKRIKKAIVVLLCISMVMTNVLPSFAEGNNESEPTIEEVVENEAEEAIEEIVEDEPEENSEDIEVEPVEDEVCEEEPEEDLPEEPEENLEMNSPEDIEEEPEEDDYEEEPEEDLAEEPEEDLSEEIEDIPEEVEEVEEENISSPSEIIDEEDEEEDSIPADMVEEPEEDEVIDEVVDEPMLLGSIASPSNTEEVEEETEEIEDEIEEATPSELAIDMPMMLGTPMFGAGLTYTLNDNWHNAAGFVNGTSKTKSHITSITIQKGGTTPAGTEFTADTGTGLKGYYTGNDIILYTPNADDVIKLNTTFRDYNSLTSINAEEFDISDRTSLDSMFQGCNTLES